MKHNPDWQLTEESRFAFWMIFEIICLGLFGGLVWMFVNIVMGLWS